MADDVYICTACISGLLFVCLGGTLHDTEEHWRFGHWSGLDSRGILYSGSITSAHGHNRRSLAVQRDSIDREMYKDHQSSYLSLKAPSIICTHLVTPFLRVLESTVLVDRISG